MCYTFPAGLYSIIYCLILFLVLIKLLSKYYALQSPYKETFVCRSKLLMSYSLLIMVKLNLYNIHSEELELHNSKH